MSQNRSVTPTAIAGDFGRRMDADKIVIHSLERDEPTTFRLYAVRLFGARHIITGRTCARQRLVDPPTAFLSDPISTATQRGQNRLLGRAIDDARAANDFVP